MDNAESIIYTAKMNAQHLHPYSDVSDVNEDLPYFHIYKNQMNQYQIHGYNHENHDNSDRMTFIKAVLQQMVFPNISRECNINGYYNIELHDSYSYLNNGINYKNCLTWSKSKSDKQGVLLPDVYHLCAYNGKLSQIDSIPWDKKAEKISFYGTTTGDRNPSNNTRIKTCLWSIDKRDLCDFYITNIAQMSYESIKQKYDNVDAVLKQPVPPSEIHKYKYNLDIPGNTCSWDRVPLILNSKTLLFKMPCNDMCFYYPFLQSGSHYVHVNNVNDIENKTNYYRNNPHECAFIINNANRFVKNYLQQHHALLYLVNLLEEASFNRS